MRDGATGRLANGSEGVGAALRAEGHPGNVCFWADDIAELRDVFGAFAMIERPSVLGTLELLEMGVAATGSGDRFRVHQPADSGHSEDNGGCDSQAESEFTGLEADGRIVPGGSRLIVHP